MNRLTRYSTALFGMALLAGLAYYQGNPDLSTDDNSSLVGTAVIENPTVEEAAKAECKPSDESEDPNPEGCDKIARK